MAGNLDPFTPTMLSLSTCDLGYELSVHGAPVGGANLAQAAKVEQGETNDLRLSCVIVRE